MARSRRWSGLHRHETFVRGRTSLTRDTTPRPEVLATARVRTQGGAAVLIAAHPGRCADCGGPIHTDDWIIWSPARTTHRRCPGSPLAGKGRTPAAPRMLNRPTP